MSITDEPVIGEISYSLRKYNDTIQHIKELFEKYQSNPYIISKIHHVICNQLPNQLETNIQMREQNSIRLVERIHTQDQFIRSFLNDCQYYYLSSTEKYFVYNGIHYQETDEDQVLYHILSSISQDRNPNLMSWKHKTKVSILKKIKENSLYKTIPESDTIQQVFDLLCPLFFSNKTETKYFLTILGDNLLRKKKESIHFISPKMKSFLRDLNQTSVFYFNNQCTQTFKFKCHEKHYDYDNKDCRLMRVQENIKTDMFWTKDIFSPIALDILCVACHYSVRYIDSDQYLLQYSNEEEIISHVFRLRDTTIDHMIEQFIQEYLLIERGDSIRGDSIRGDSIRGDSIRGEEDDKKKIGDSSPFMFSSPSSSLSSSPQEIFFIQQLQEKNANPSLAPLPPQNMSWKNMLFLWKQFLHKHHFPLNLYQPLIKPKLISSLFFQKQYQVDTDTFIGIGSSQLPIIQQFLKFWNETMGFTEETSASSELEINEISVLFRIWAKGSVSSGSSIIGRIPKKEMGYLNETKIIDILSFFFPEIEIIQNKFIFHLQCSLWDKNKDIGTALLEMYKNVSSIRLYHDPDSILDISAGGSINNAYLFYCKFYSNIPPEKRLIVSKSYFEKYIDGMKN